MERLKNRGFSLIGVMVASALGLIIITGITHLFVQMSSRLNSLSNQQKRGMFYDYLKSHLSDINRCNNTLKTLDSSSFDIPGIDGNGDGDLTDSEDINFYLSSGREKLKNDFGIENYQVLMTYKRPVCRSLSPACTGLQTATIEIVTMEEIHGKIPIFNKDFIMTIDVDYDTFQCSYNLVKECSSLPSVADIKSKINSISTSLSEKDFFDQLQLKMWRCFP